MQASFITIFLSLGGTPPGEKRIREDAVYITNLRDGVTDEEIKELFGSLGIIKVHTLC